MGFNPAFKGLILISVNEVVFRWNMCYSCVIDIHFVAVVPKDLTHLEQSSQTQKTGSAADVGGSRSPVTVLPVMSASPGTRFQHERTAGCFEHRDG